MKNIYLFFIIISVFLISLDRILPLNILRNLGKTVLTPVAAGIYEINFHVQQSAGYLLSLPGLYRENQKLAEELTATKEVMADYYKVKKENEALRMQLDVQGAFEGKKVMATVIAIHEDGKAISILTNKGSADGIRVGAVVVIGNRLVGKVTNVNSNNSDITPIFSVDSRVPVELINKSEKKIKGVVRGMFNSKIILDEVTQEYQFAEGDLVVTSEEGGLFPPGLLIGEIEKVNSQERELFQIASLKPFWQLSDVKTVFISYE
jgi:rod shape-determining protein MreC